MTQLEQTRLIQNGRRLYIQLEQCASRCLAPKGITAVQAHILLFLLSRQEQSTLLTDIHRAFGFSQEELCALDRLQQKLLRNLSPLMKETQKEESKS